MELHHKTILRRAGLFQGINDAACNALIDCLSPQVKRYAKNEILFLAGNRVVNIGVILSGTARASLEHIDGSQTILSNLAPLCVFGEILANVKTQESPVTVYATSDVTAAFIAYQNIYAMCAASCEAHRMFLQNLQRAIGEKYFLLFDRLNILREKTLRARIMAYLYTLSNRGKSTVVTLPFSKTMLADYLLANRSALSKELRKMKRDGLIAFQGRTIEILF